MGTQEVELECAGEKSAVDGSDPVCSFIHNSYIHLGPGILGRVTHDSHKLQTKAINHSTRHYMHRRELESDQPIHVPLLRVLSFPPSAGQPQCIVAIARRRAPHLATTRKDTAAATVLRCMHCYSYTRRLVVARTEYESKPFKRRRSEDCRYKVRPRAHSVVMSCIKAGRHTSGRAS